MPRKTVYEWLECSIVPVGEPAERVLPQSFQIGHLTLVDQAIEGHAGGYRLCEPPLPIDAEHETEFTERWMFRLAKASRGRLRELLNSTSVTPTIVALELPTALTAGDGDIQVATDATQSQDKA